MQRIQPYHEKQITINSNYELSATISIPQEQTINKLPSILLIAGSGRMDRDVNAPQIKTDIFKHLASFFASRGIVTLRYDKRGCGKSAGDFYSAGINDFIDDAKACVKYLKFQDFIDSNKIIILGHSEGAIIAPAVYNTEPSAGLILICGAIDSGNELLPKQPQKLAQEIRNDNSLKAKVLKLFHLDKFIVWQFKHIYSKALSSNKDIIKILGLFKFNAKWLREFNTYDIKKYLGNISCPTLVIGASKDIQTNPDDAKKIANKIQNSESKIIINMNHLLREYSGEHSFLGCIKQYKQSVKLPLNKDLLTILDEWLIKISAP